MQASALKILGTVNTEICITGYFGDATETFDFHDDLPKCMKTTPIIVFSPARSQPTPDTQLQHIMCQSTRFSEIICRLGVSLSSHFRWGSNSPNLSFWDENKDFQLKRFPLYLSYEKTHRNALYNSSTCASRQRVLHASEKIRGWYHFWSNFQNMPPNGKDSLVYGPIGQCRIIFDR